jgi:stearoyl-CoA desaturase (delta-9 desaturase)
MKPAQNKFVSVAALGEGWHNYHHVFPWDYKSDELSGYTTNLTTLVIDLFCWLGLAYDPRKVPEDVVFNRIVRTGDGSHPLALRL